ncbi:MAG: hypothetical protein O7C73_06250, partial [Nitrospirae bacterium]|nr:hypothetical protein [Nitrospirota bacterium]
IRSPEGFAHPPLWPHPTPRTTERQHTRIPRPGVLEPRAVVSTGFPAPDAGWVPAAPATVALTLSAALVIFG